MYSELGMAFLASSWRAGKSADLRSYRWRVGRSIIQFRGILAHRPWNTNLQDRRRLVSVSSGEIIYTTIPFSPTQRLLSRLPLAVLTSHCERHTLFSLIRCHGDTWSKHLSATLQATARQLTSHWFPNSSSRPSPALPSCCCAGSSPAELRGRGPSQSSLILVAAAAE